MHVSTHIGTDLINVINISARLSPYCIYLHLFTSVVRRPARLPRRRLLAVLLQEIR